MGEGLARTTAGSRAASTTSTTPAIATATPATQTPPTLRTTPSTGVVVVEVVSRLERYPKASYEAVRRQEAPPPPPPRPEMRDSDRRAPDHAHRAPDHAPRRNVALPDRPAPRAPPPPSLTHTHSHSRSPREPTHTHTHSHAHTHSGWKGEGNISSNKGDIRGGVRGVHAERSGGRDGPSGPLRGAGAASRGRSGGFTSGSMDTQHFSGSRQVVVERHGREAGPRKDWGGASHSSHSGHASSFSSDGRRMDTSRPIMNSHSSSGGMNRIVQITNSSMSPGNVGGGFKSFKGAPRRF